MARVDARKPLFAAEERIAPFLERVRRAPSRVLMLDYDGTLSPFCNDPEKAAPYPEIPPLLERMRRETDTRLIVVTGRRAADAARLLGVEGLEIWGSHGLERLRPDGSYEMAKIDPRTIGLIADADELLASEGLAGMAEYKPAGIAIHWRGREALADETKQKVMRIWSMLKSRDGLLLAPFDGGMEIRTTTRNKGDAVRAVMAEAGAGTGAAIAYLGDDLTDEDAFAALTGYGLSVLVRGEYRDTLADVWVRPPAGVLGFLHAWIAAS